MPKSSDKQLQLNSSFKSFADFDQLFSKWCKDSGYQFRIGSSETLKDSQTLQAQFKYRYVVYHCVHYGEPRVRGLGKRPNQSYLSCGCKASIRLNFIEKDHCLRVMKMVAEHTGHGADSQKDSYRYASTFVKGGQDPNRIAYSDAGEEYREHFDTLYNQQKTYVERMRKEVQKYKSVLNAEREENGLDKFYPLPIVAESVDFFMKIMNKKTVFSHAEQEEYDKLEEVIFDEYSDNGAMTLF